MPIAKVNGVDLYYEETGQGFPLVWSHEFGGDHRSWEPQVRYFGRRYRVVTYNHRGYPPSEVPKDANAYSQDALIEDLHQLLLRLGIRHAHICGCSMGANVALNFALAHPAMTKSVVVVGGGAGTVAREQFVSRQGATADALEREGIESDAALLPAEGPAGVGGVRRLHPRALARGVRASDPRRHAAAAHGHPDRAAAARAACADAGDRRRRGRALVPGAGLLVVPRTGHTVNIEEPGLFNLHVAEFLAAVEQNRWAP